MKYLSILIIIIFLTNCSPSEDYKTIRKEVLTIHDEVMAHSELTYHEGKKLDTLLSQMDSLQKVNSALDTVTFKKEITALKSQFSKAENNMESWMRNFDVDLGNKSKDEAINYFKKEKQKIQDLDSMYKNGSLNFNKLKAKYNL